ncbi:hypothetical protein halTADL_1033 [Halohasta litchfieldiae]|jgi:hypothetical protein|uniref:Uncharacterized protein n=1 Tax=Halohasta litchfieldiae TaxID=1073996 RepID=A0A1H6S7K5_9EURY|nr:hypothetical protein [Halohasta litchfieldiae]ATW87827.1 hypothetical protein halTADL_1033 [Halohasta litchfieldiae]SEI64098.1 hypothetical protein SAMN05444271_104165 [Halohasta litchfieldiae]
MPDPSHLRDSTQIELPAETLNGFRDQLEAEFTVTILQDDSTQCRIVGSPVEIKAVSGFLSRHGVALR